MSGCDCSIIIPALNEEEHIGGVLDAIRSNLEGRLSYEVILVDNGSRDRTVEIARAGGAICLQAPGRSISALRNLGVELASSEILIFIDGDVYPSIGWGDRLGHVLARVRSAPGTVTGSLYGICTPASWIERVWFAPRITGRKVGYINGGHLILHRQFFYRINGFAAHLETGEDCDFCDRARQAGAVIENDPELQVVHAGYPRTVLRFFCRERWHGRGDFHSLSTVAASRPALISLANLLALAACVGCAAAGLLPWYLSLLFYALFLGGVAFLSALHRQSWRPDSSLSGVFLLYLVYISARSLSLLDVLTRNAARYAGKSAPVARRSVSGARNEN